MARKIEVEILGNDRSLTNAFRRSSREARTWNNSVTRAGRGALVATVGFRGLGRSIAFASGAFVGGAGLVAGLKASIQGFSSFQEEMQRATGLGDVAQKSIAKFSRQVLDLSTTVGKSPQELAHAFYIVASSGIAASRAMSVVTAAAKLSVAGLGDTATVVDAITSAMNAYGPANLSAAKAANTLAATVREGKGEAAQFAPVIGNVVSLASQLGVSFNEVGAALAGQTRLGTDAETSATQLQRIFQVLIKTTPKEAKALDSVGLSAKKLKKELSSPDGLLKFLATIRNVSNNTKNVDLIAHIFGDIRGQRGILNLVGKQFPQILALFKRMENTAGSAQKAFGAIDKTTAQQFRRLKASAQVLGVDLGAIFAPIAGAAAKGLTIATQDLDKFVQKIQKAKGFTAKLDVVTTGVKGLGQKVSRDLLREFNKIDFHELGHEVGFGIAHSLEDVLRAVQGVDWGKVGKVIADDISKFVATVNWGRLFVDVFIKVPHAIINATSELLIAAGKELILKVLEGIRTGGSLALLFVEKWALSVVKKVVDAFGFLGKFDPFKGLSNRIAKQIKEVQGEIDKLHGKTITVKVHTVFKSENENVGPLRSGIATGKGNKGPSVKDTSTTLDLTGSGHTGKVDPKVLASKLQGALDAVTSRFDVALKRASLTPIFSDDLKVLNQEKAALEKLHAAHKGNLKIESALLDVVSQIQQAQKDAFQRQLDTLDIALSKAALTPQLSDDLAILKREQSLIQKQVKLHRDDLDLRQKLVGVQGQINQLNQQAISDATNLFGSLFDLRQTATGEPVTFLGGSRGKPLFGGSDAQSLLRTLKANNDSFAREIKDITTLQKRGAPAGFIRAAFQGQISPDILDTLAHANKATLEKVFKQFSRSQKLITKVAKMEVTAPSVAIKASKVAINASPGVPAGARRGGNGDIVIHTHTHLDGREIEKSTTRVKKRRANQRRGGVGGLR